MINLLPGQTHIVLNECEKHTGDDCFLSSLTGEIKAASPTLIYRRSVKLTTLGASCSVNTIIRALPLAKHTDERRGASMCCETRSDVVVCTLLR